MISLTKIVIACLLFCGSVFAQKGVKKSDSEVLKMYGYEKNVNRHRKYPNVQIGDSTVPGKAKARISFKGWDDEVGFEIDLGGSSQLTIPNNYTKNKGQKNGQDSVQIIGNNHYHAMFVTADNRFEWSVVLEQEPPVSSVTFPFTSNGLSFYWQDTLTDEEVTEGAFRPDSVIYSYAVYHSTKANNYNKTDGSTEEYGTGKYGHSYRPKAWDNLNDTVWISLLIDTIANELTVSWDSAWMANATYPVTLDPTVGLTSQGGTEDAINAAQAHGHANSLDVYTAEASKQIERMTIWTRVTTGNEGETLDLAVYRAKPNGGSFELTTRETNAETITINNTSADSLHTGALAVAMIQDTVYSVAWGGWSTTSSIIQVYFDGADGTRDRQTSSPLGTSWVHSSFRTTNKFSVFYTYGDAGAVTNPQVIIMGQ